MVRAQQSTQRASLRGGIPVNLTYGSSHQIMHVLVICGAFSHTIGLVQAFDYWQGLLAREGGACPQA